MELRQIRTFVVVAEELHFGRASLRLNLAQPAVTAQIQALERELGLPLFTRTTRRVLLTEPGLVFFEQCGQILRDVDRGLVMTRTAAGKNPYRITIGTTHSATFGVLPAFLTRMQKRYPDIGIHIQNGTTETIIQGIERGTINLGFVRPIENSGSLRWKAITREKYQLAISRNNPLCQQKVITLQDLRQQPIISFARASPSYTERYFFEHFRQYGLESQITCTCNDTLSMIALVSAGIGVGFVPEWVEGTFDQDLVLRPVEGVDLAISLGLVWSQDDPTANRESIIDLCGQLNDV